MGSLVEVMVYVMVFCVLMLGFNRYEFLHGIEICIMLEIV